MAHGRSDFWEVAYVFREVVKYFTKSGRNVGSTTWKLEKSRKSLWNWRIRKWQKRNGHFWWITVIDKKTYLVNKKILVEIIAPTRIMAQLELRPTSELRVFIIARTINWNFTLFRKTKRKSVGYILFRQNWETMGAYMTPSSELNWVKFGFSFFTWKCLIQDFQRGIFSEIACKILCHKLQKSFTTRRQEIFWYLLFSGWKIAYVSPFDLNLDIFVH